MLILANSPHWNQSTYNNLIFQGDDTDIGETPATKWKQEDADQPRPTYAELQKENRYLKE